MKHLLKTLLRKLTGLLIAGPFALLIHIHSIFTGKQKAIIFWGPVVQFVVKIIAEICVVPSVKTPEEFNTFIKKMKRKIWFLRPLYDISVAHQSDDTLILNYHNCPHCEAFIKLGLPEIGPYACESDWDIARSNAGLWEFERTCQIGTGASFCDHTYKRHN